LESRLKEDDTTRAFGTEMLTGAAETEAH